MTTRPKRPRPRSITSPGSPDRLADAAQRTGANPDGATPVDLPRQTPSRPRNVPGRSDPRSPEGDHQRPVALGLRHDGSAVRMQLLGGNRRRRQMSRGKLGLLGAPERDRAAQQNEGHHRARDDLPAHVRAWALRLHGKFQGRP